MSLRQGDGREMKYEVRSTRYEVKELGATRLREHGWRRQSQNDVWEINPCTREVGTHVAGGCMKRYSRGTTVHHKWHVRLQPW